MLAFKQKNRIKSKSHFNEIFSYQHKMNTKGFVVYYCKSEQRQSKYAFVASKRVGNAASRNYAKRLMREIVRLNQLRLNCGLDMIFIAKSAIIEYDFLELNKHFLYLSAQHELLNQSD